MLHTDLLHVSEHALVALTLAGPLVEVAPAVVPGTWAGITPTVTLTLLLSTVHNPEKNGKEAPI